MTKLPAKKNCVTSEHLLTTKYELARSLNKLAPPPPTPSVAKKSSVTSEQLLTTKYELARSLHKLAAPPRSNSLTLRKEQEKNNSLIHIENINGRNLISLVSKKAKN